MTIIDASVYIALVNRHEKFHEHSLHWFQQAIATRTPMSAPAILLAEVAAAIERGQNNSELTRQAVAYVRNSRFISLHPVSIALAESAAKIAGEQRIRGCDAVYAALALHLNQPLITLDHQLAHRAGGVVHVIQLWDAS